VTRGRTDWPSSIARPNLHIVLASQCSGSCVGINRLWQITFGHCDSNEQDQRNTSAESHSKDSVSRSADSQ